MLVFVLASLISFSFPLCHWKKEEIKHFFEIRPEYLTALEHEKVPLSTNFSTSSNKYGSNIKFDSLSFNTMQIQTVFRRSRTKNAVVMGLKGINPVVELSSLTTLTNSLFTETCKYKVILEESVFDVLLELKLESGKFKIVPFSPKNPSFKPIHSNSCLFTSKNRAEIEGELNSPQFLSQIEALVYPKIADLIEKSVNKKNHILSSIADSAYSLRNFKINTLFVYLEFSHQKQCLPKIDFFLNKGNKAISFFNLNLFTNKLPEFKATVKYYKTDLVWTFFDPKTVELSGFWLSVMYTGKYTLNSVETEQSVIVYFNYTIKEKNKLVISLFKMRIDNKRFDFKEPIDFPIELGDSQGQIRNIMRGGILFEKY